MILVGGDADTLLVVSSLLQIGAALDLIHETLSDYAGIRLWVRKWGKD